MISLRSHGSGCIVGNSDFTVSILQQRAASLTIGQDPTFQVKKSIWKVLWCKHGLSPLGLTLKFATTWAVLESGTFKRRLCFKRDYCFHCYYQCFLPQGGVGLLLCCGAQVANMSLPLMRSLGFTYPLVYHWSTTLRRNTGPHQMWLLDLRLPVCRTVSQNKLPF